MVLLFMAQKNVYFCSCWRKIVDFAVCVETIVLVNVSAQ